ncbi:MAG: hypothetical protein IRZ11_00830 [Clostridia bacterium]|nr:hypothetical protein [Clostridia bacterium]
MDDERLRILNMVAEGKVTAEEAAKLLDALAPRPQPARAAAAKGGAPSRWLRIRVSSGEERVSVNVPLRLLDAVKGFLPQGGISIGGAMIDLDEILDLVREGMDGKLVEVKGADGEEVEIYVE